MGINERGEAAALGCKQWESFGQRCQHPWGAGTLSPQLPMGCWHFSTWKRMEPEALKPLGYDARPEVPSDAGFQEKSQEVIKWKRSEKEEVLVPQPFRCLGWSRDGCLCPGQAVAASPGVSPPNTPLIYSSEPGVHLPSGLLVGPVPWRFLTSWVKWDTSPAVDGVTV